MHSQHRQQFSRRGTEECHIGRQELTAKLLYTQHGGLSRIIKGLADNEFEPFVDSYQCGTVGEQLKEKLSQFTHHTQQL